MKQYRPLPEDAVYLYRRGACYHAHHILGAHAVNQDPSHGFLFRVWAPFVRKVSVIGSFHDWQEQEMQHRDGGIWECVIPEARSGDAYKFRIETQHGEILDKAAPYAFYAEQRPNTASLLCAPSDFVWTDDAFMRQRADHDPFRRPLNIYEVHFGSWRQHQNDGPAEETPIAYFLTYRELAQTLVPYVKDMGYTHIEIMPIMEHPYDGSWGYQLSGYFAPTSRYGTPDDFRYFVDCCHAAGLGVILDWVPGHFCPDAHSLGRFNGEALYETRKHPQWGTYEFDFGRGEVRSFLFSSAVYWIEEFHIDGLRVDGVTSMLYLNYGVEDHSLHRRNADGGEEDLAAIRFLSELNQTLAIKYPGFLTMAEESTAYPLITYPPNVGGLGFHYKWDMGWMHDTLCYLETDLEARHAHHHLISFSMMYAFTENFILALSHDEVVHGKRSLLGRMGGDYWRQFANLRLLLLYQMTHSGAKLNFMGSELAPYLEWRYYQPLEWFLLSYDMHRAYHHFVKTLNHLFLAEPALWEQNHGWHGFTWLEADNAAQSIYLYMRQSDHDSLVVLLNFTAHTYEQYRIGVPLPGAYREIVSSDHSDFGGSGQTNADTLYAEDIPMHGQPYSLVLRTPPLGGFIINPDPTAKSAHTRTP